MIYRLGSLTGLMIHWGLFELSSENRRFWAIWSRFSSGKRSIFNIPFLSHRARTDIFRPFLAFFALKSVTFDLFDPSKGSSYKLLPSILTYSEGIVARQWESVEKGVRRANFSVLGPQIGDLWPFDPKKGSSYKILPSVRDRSKRTYSEGIVALQWESVEKGVTRSFRGNLVPFFVRETVNFQYFGLKI